MRCAVCRIASCRFQLPAVAKPRSCTIRVLYLIFFGGLPLPGLPLPLMLVACLCGLGRVAVAVAVAVRVRVRVCVRRVASRHAAAVLSRTVSRLVDI